MPELGRGVLKRHSLTWSMSRTIGCPYKCVVGLINLPGIVSCLRFATSLGANWGNVAFNATFVTHSSPVWTCLSLRMVLFATANALTLLL